MDDDINAAAGPIRGGAGRILLRMEPALHERLRLQAQQTGLSLNEHSVRRLGAAGPSGGPGAWPVLARAVEIAGARLSGVAVFGSWARGQARAASDIDVLVVLEEGTAVTRELYRRWDAQPAQEWEGHVVEPHFVALPGPDARLTGLWAEVSMDGLVLYDRDLTLGRLLAGYRSAIARGAAQRRWINGQAYWVAA